MQVKFPPLHGTSTAEQLAMVPRSLLLPRRLLVLLALAGALLGSGCCVIDGTCSISSEAAVDNGGGDFEDNRGAPESATPGCDPSAIRESGDVVCATCEFGEDAICGEADFAACESRENGLGESCQLCITPTGAVLYDDCFSNGEGVTDAAFCEPTPGRQEGEVCNTCFDSFGAAVSTSCAPEADACSAFVADDGRSCSVCSTADGNTFTVCDNVDIDPAFCRAYENDVGRCVDCFGSDRSLLSHTCSPQNGVRVCEERVENGLICSVCFNDSGFVVEQSCAEGVPQVERCEQLVFSEQTCVVCVDAKGDVAVVDCAANACTGLDADVACRSDADCGEAEACFDGACVQRVGDPSEPAPGGPEDDCSVPACTMSVDGNGDVCRTCPTSTGLTETLCLGAGPLRCESISEDSLPAPPSDDVGEDNLGEAERPGSAPQGRTCVVCADPAGVEVYRDCEGNGAVPPPYCSDVVTADNDLCTVCFDAITDAAVYTSCAEASCYDRRDTELQDRNGVALTVDNQIAVATCQLCSDGDSIDASCQLQQTCDTSLVADPSTCQGNAELRLRPRVCENPWEGYRRSASRRDDLAGLMAYALDQHGLVVQSANTAADPASPACDVDDCSCPRGDLVVIIVDNADAAAAAFGDLVLR